LRQIPAKKPGSNTGFFKKLKDLVTTFAATTATATVSTAAATATVSTAAAASTTIAATATATTAATTIRTGFSLVDADFSVIPGRAVKVIDCCLLSSFRIKIHKRETARTASFPIHRNFNRLHFAVLSESFNNFLLSRRKGQVAYK
jgi:hypothetical protein